MGFHFSPRPNRASEIDWHAWGPDAFAEAETSGKPILLSLSAVWCHWCHVMDETSYSDPAVIARINERFMPIRVDADERPDVNARYNMGGWPTTAFLTSDGQLLGGATYVPPQAMLNIVDEVASAWESQKGAIAQRVRRRIGELAEPAPDEGQLTETIVQATLRSIESTFDDLYGGFGTEPKFPQSPVLGLLLLEHERRANRGIADLRLLQMVTKTLHGMGDGGMYDHVEGGFFRYSTTRDWSVPHFEKMLEDHAGLLPLYARAWRLTDDTGLRVTLEAAIAYLRDTLRDEATGLYGGSQDADEAYYALQTREQRRAVTAPYIDRTVYVNWNAMLASAFLAVSRDIGDSALAAGATRILDAIDAEFRDERGLAFHFRRPGGTPQIQNLLVDQVAYLRASLDAHDVTGESRFLGRAVALADVITGIFGVPGGLFVDHANSDDLGLLAIADRPLAENANLADAFLRLATMTADERWHERAIRVIEGFSERYAGYRSFAAPYAAAVARALSPTTSIALIGTPQATRGLREAAHALRDPSLVTFTLAPGDPTLSARGFVARGESAAYPCVGTICGAAVTDPDSLGEALQRLAAA